MHIVVIRLHLRVSSFHFGKVFFGEGVADDDFGGHVAGGWFVKGEEEFVDDDGLGILAFLGGEEVYLCDSGEGMVAAHGAPDEGEGFLVLECAGVKADRLLLARGESGGGAEGEHREENCGYVFRFHVFCFLWVILTGSWCG